MKRLLATAAALAVLLTIVVAGNLVSVSAQVVPNPETRVFTCAGTTNANAVITCTFPTGVAALSAAPTPVNGGIVLVTVLAPAGGQSNLPDNISVTAATTTSVQVRIIGTQIVHYAGPEPGGHDGPLAYRNGNVELRIRASVHVMPYCNANPCS
jgi:hypothetical protein